MIISLVGVVFSRLLPHVANFTVTQSMVCSLGFRARRGQDFLWLAVILCITDLLLSYVYHYRAFGNWSLFTYTGYFFLWQLGRWQQSSGFAQVGVILFGVLGYWLWTNFGVWLTTPTYLASISDFLSCYLLALPFLYASLLANLIAGLMLAWVSVRKVSFA